MPQLVLLRHGQSRWNLENRFTGWVDVDLTPEGEAQARRAGELIAEAGVRFDGAFTSVLRRAIETCRMALQTAGQPGVHLEQNWRLNERHYGGLTGLDKAETTARHGEEQVRIWRRSYDVPPPPLEPGGPYDFASDPRYAGADIPDSESLKTTLERVLPYWEAQIAPRLREGQNLLVAAHGNSLRAIVKHLFGVSESEIVGLEIPTGNPLLIELDEALRPLSARYLDQTRAEALPGDGVSASDEGFMRRAIEVARPHLGLTAPNPTVGCVLVLNDAVVAEAVTGRGGRPHAEEQALEMAGPQARGCTAYVTLEPCGERTSGAPSCAERLAAAGVARVVAAGRDPSPYASSRGLERLTAAGVLVEIGLLAQEAAFALG